MASTQTQSKGDYHGHPNYFAIWLALIVLFGASLLLGFIDGERGNKALAVSLIFGLAVVKAILVLGNFMHLRWEPKFVWLAGGFGVLCMFFLYFGVMPDMHWVPLQVAKP